MEKLALWVIGRVEDFPRKHRFIVGDKRIETCIDNLRAANRNNNTPTNRNNNIGFRCAKTGNHPRREDARRSRGHGSAASGDPLSSPACLAPPFPVPGPGPARRAMRPQG